MSMEKRKYKFIKIIHKSNDSTYQNPLGDMNKIYYLIGLKYCLFKY